MIVFFYRYLFNKAAFIFLSTIVLRRFAHDQKLEFRKLEATTKKY